MSLSPQPALRLGFVTLFPEVIETYLKSSILGRAARSEKVRTRVSNPRDFAYDPHRKVDDTPYGGEAGMLMRPEPVRCALADVLESELESRDSLPDRTAVVITEPGGRRFDQAAARELAEFSSVVFVCGHYEGIDHRFEERFATHVFSIGDYVLTGGELPALVMADAIVRLIPEVLGSPDSLAADSFSSDPQQVAAPNYTRPPVWMGMEVPAVLRSGDHAKIERWRAEISRERTRLRESATRHGESDPADA